MSGAEPRGSGDLGSFTSFTWPFRRRETDGSSLRRSRCRHRRGCGLSRQAQHEQRAAFGRPRGPHRAAVPHRDLPHDGQPEPGPGHRPCARSTGRSGRTPAADPASAMPGPASATSSTHRPRVERPHLHPDRPAWRAPLGGVVEQIQHRAFQRGRVTDERPRHQRRVELDVARPSSTRSSARDDHVGELQRLVDDLRRVLPRQLDQVAHQRRQLRDLRLQVVEDLGAIRLGQRRRPGFARPRSAAPGSSASTSAGVRSSWPASATSRRCCSWDAASAPSMSLKLAVSRASSSEPSTGIGRSSPVAATRSVASVSCCTGRRPVRATATPASAAIATPTPPIVGRATRAGSALAGVASSRCADHERAPLPGGHGDHPVRTTGPRSAVRTDDSASPRATSSSSSPAAAPWPSPRADWARPFS